MSRWERHRSCSSGCRRSSPTSSGRPSRVRPTAPSTTWRRSPRSPRRSRRRCSGRGKRRMRAPDQLRALADEYVGELALTPELSGLEEAVLYALVGGKRVRAVICLATTEAAGCDPETALPAAAALELVH